VTIVAAGRTDVKPVNEPLLTAELPGLNTGFRIQKWGIRALILDPESFLFSLGDPVSLR
jgi:hypothetical protein